MPLIACFALSVEAIISSPETEDVGSVSNQLSEHEAIISVHPTANAKYFIVDFINCLIYRFQNVKFKPNVKIRADTNVLS
ncbi:unknown [Bacteroides sp. CAG:702]|nr:unknown [Bacteroides sp. CAG:702]